MSILGHTSANGWNDCLVVLGAFDVVLQNILCASNDPQTLFFYHSPTCKIELVMFLVYTLVEK